MRKFLLLVMALACSVAASAYTYRVMINAENFPDANFRAYLQSMPWGANGYVDDPFTITVMDCSGRDISSLVGIEFFNMLKELDCSNNNLTELPDNENGTFGQTMGELQSLRCDGNAFKTLNLPDLRATVVNVSSCLELESLVLPGSKVSELYCYNNPKLKNLSLPCEGMAGALTRLNCSEGSLTWLDLSAFGKLEYLDCSDNDLTLLTVSDASPLSELRINRNNIKGKAMDTMIGSLPARPSPTQFRAMYNADGNVMTTAQVAASKAKKWVPMFSNGPSWVEYAGTKPVAPPYGTLEPYLIEVTGNTLSDFGNEGYHKMFDGDLMTQWRVVHPGDNWQTVSVEFMSKKPFIPTAYTFYTAKDTYSHPNRNPKQWTLYGKKELDDDWTVLSGAQGDWLGAANLADYKFPIDNHGECRFFRLEVNNVGDAEDGNFIMQLAEFDMEGLPGSGGTETDPSRFDINGDGNADVGDVNAVLAAILDADNSEAFDVNGDGNVDVGDVNAVLECILNGGIADNKVTVTVGDVSFKMVPVNGGLFLMGSTQGSAYNRSDEEPVHLVSLSDYWLGETEVTEGLWKAVMGSAPELSSAKGDNYPVEGAFMYEIDEFISRLNQMTGLTFALPTEAQWEFAARGGRLSRGYVYAGSDNIDDVAWYNSNSNSIPQTVGTRAPNELGLYDMSGNVYEWVEDWYAGYNGEDQVDPLCTEGSIPYRVTRSGSVGGTPKYSRISYRGVCQPESSNLILGLRLAM